MRKDISSTGIEGRPKIGFEIAGLIKRITAVLGWDTPTEALIIGAGNLGSALAAYNGFDAYRLRITAIFDKDPDKRGMVINNLSVMPMEELAAYIKQHSVTVAVIAVPALQAQPLADLLVKLGIKGIWNFAPGELKVPENVVVQRTDLATAFAVLSVRMRERA